MDRHYLLPFVLTLYWTSISAKPTTDVSNKDFYCSKDRILSDIGTDVQITRISLSDQCKDGHISWSTESSTSHQLVQFHKNHSSFGVCLYSNSTSLTLKQLKGSSKKHIVKKSAQSDELGCIKSHCNHISLLLTTVPVNKEHHLKYKLIDHNDCPRCSDNCLQNIICSSDYRTVHKATLSSKKYINQVRIENFLRYNNTYVLAKYKQCSQLPTTSALNADHHIPYNGIVNVMSQCTLKEGQRYFFGTNLKVGYLNKGKLMLGCAQQDVQYMMYQFDKMLNNEDLNCC